MKDFQIKDRIYSTQFVTHPLIQELILSAPMQRLKHITQNGIPEKYYHTKSYSRFEHSIGVYMLLHRLGASEKEQVAGLLHDVSHTAFSHVIDWVVGDSQFTNYQEDTHAQYLKQTKLDTVLHRYSYNCDEIADIHRYTLLDRDMPDICADRLDYTLREMEQDVAQMCVRDLTVYENQLIFKHQAVAHTFAVSYLDRSIHHWAGMEAAVRYELLAQAIREALKIGLMKRVDFWLTDELLMDRLVSSNNRFIHHIIGILSNKSLSHFPVSSKKIYPKFRFVDPYFLDGNVIKRLSTVDADFKRRLAHAKRTSKLGIYLPEISLTNTS